jgi:hypothetical protein
MDLSKISPAPWQADERVRCAAVYSGEKVNCFDDLDDVICYKEFGEPASEARIANWEFIALARNAFDVMMRRRWFVVPQSWAFDEGKGAKIVRRWGVRGDGFDLDEIPRNGTFSDPFTALVEADRWYKEYVDSKGDAS